MKKASGDLADDLLRGDAIVIVYTLFIRPSALELG